MESQEVVQRSGSDLVGPLTRDVIERELPAWAHAIAEARVDRDVARELSSVPPGAVIEVFLGTWCGDSRRELSRFFRALDELPTGTAPFTVRLIGLDRAKRGPAAEEQGRDIRYVPTFIVLRDGVEIGRIVESAPNGIERELALLLSGTASGVISGRPDL